MVFSDWFDSELDVAAWKSGTRHILSAEGRRRPPLMLSPQIEDV
jgi:hypothetical protein